MPSPFPGMNPYLEQDRVWHDFHERAIPAIADHLAAQIAPRFVTKIDEHLFIHEPPAEARRLVGRGDIAVADTATSSGSVAAVADAPATVVLPGIDIERLSFVEIRDRDDWTLVSVIELLSPSNKAPGPDREQFLGKRARLLHSTAHYIELDLLRGGPRLPLEELPPCDYYALVSQVEERPRAGLWPLALRDPLPDIPVPLRLPFAPARLDLMSILNRVYDAARYESWIYSREPQPPLSEDAAAWARDLVPR